MSIELQHAQDEDGNFLAANGLPYVTQQPCLKCGEGDAMLQYIRLPGSECSQKQVGCPDGVGEHMHRRCRECGFEWPEACDDTPPMIKEA